MQTASLASNWPTSKRDIWNSFDAFHLLPCFKAVRVRALVFWGWNQRLFARAARMFHRVHHWNLKYCHFQILCALFQTIWFAIYQVWGEAGNIRFMPGILREAENGAAFFDFLELEKIEARSGVLPHRAGAGFWGCTNGRPEFFLGDDKGGFWCSFKWIFTGFLWISSEVLGDLDVI